MSIVQKALEKMQKSAGAALAPVAAAPVAAPAPTARAERGESHRPARPHLIINRENLRAVGVLPAQSEERRLAEEFRRIKRPLVDRALAAPTESDARVIMVTSAMPGEGKTFTAINLAFNLALERDSAVLLVDGDVPKPQIGGLLGLKGRPGLVDALLNPDIDIESLILGTDVANLALLGAGTRSDAAPELFASRRMTEVMAGLKAGDARRIVVIDSPPLLWTAESRELASAAGQIVLVVRAGETPRQAVYDAIAALGEGKNVSLVLNQTDSSSIESSYYGYGYGDSDAAHNPPLGSGAAR
jgi:protein-tyrosine kinase